MEIRNIQSNPTHFKALDYSDVNKYSNELVQAIKNSPAVKAVGKKYNGYVTIKRFSSISQPNNPNFGLFFRDLETTNPIKKLINKFLGKIDNHFIQYNSGVKTEKEFAEILMKLKKKTFLS